VKGSTYRKCGECCAAENNGTANCGADDSGAANCGAENCVKGKTSRNCGECCAADDSGAANCGATNCDVDDSETAKCGAENCVSADNSDKTREKMSPLRDIKVRCGTSPKCNDSRPGGMGGPKIIFIVYPLKIR
jgi:hypothetical protein